MPPTYLRYGMRYKETIATTMKNKWTVGNCLLRSVQAEPADPPTRRHSSSGLVSVASSRRHRKQDCRHQPAGRTVSPARRVRCVETFRNISTTRHDKRDLRENRHGSLGVLALSILLTLLITQIVMLVPLSLFRSAFWQQLYLLQYEGVSV